MGMRGRRERGGKGREGGGGRREWGNLKDEEGNKGGGGGSRGEGKEGGTEYLARRAPLTAPSPPGAPGRRLGGGAAVRDVSAPRSLPALRPRVPRPAWVQSPSPGAPPLRLPLSLGGWSPLASGLLPGQPAAEGGNCPETQHLSGRLCKARGRRPGAAALTPQRPGMQAGARGARGPGRLRCSRCRRGPSMERASA